MRETGTTDFTSLLADFVLDHQPEPVLVLDGSGSVLTLNRAARDERNESLLEFFDTHGRSELVLEFLNAVRRNGRARLELSGANAIRVGPFAFEGFAVRKRIVVIARDQSERRALEEELRHLRRIESLGLVTASVIHDFNNLMTPMLALSSMLANELRASSTSLDLVADIESIANRTATLFRDMVALAKPRRRTPEVVELVELVATMRPLLERVAGESIELRLAVEDDANSVCVERSRLEHALLNLVANARQAMPHGGTITISASRVSGPNEGTATGAVELVVSDTGEGMTEYVRAHATDDFFTTREGRGGTGLGLASIRRFVAESGGQLSIDSEPGRGASVTIRLPDVVPGKRT